MRSGRPSNEDVVARRQSVRLLICNSVLTNNEAIEKIAAKLGAPDRVIRGDLEAIQAEIERPPSKELTGSLAQAIEDADTFKTLKNLGKRVMQEMVKQTIDCALGRALIDAIKLQRQVLLRARDEEVEAAVTALEILTPQEQEVLKKYRESLVPPALKPGEFPAPPENEP